MERIRLFFNNFFREIIFIISLLIIVLTFFSYILYDSFGIGQNYKLSTDKLGHFGDFVGGFLGTILTIIATIYIYQTFNAQKKSIEIQEDQLKNQKKELKSQKIELQLQRQLIAQQQFESTFFNMLNVHRELKNNLSSEDKIFWFNETQLDFLTSNNNTPNDKIGLINEIVSSRKKKGVEIFRNIRLDLLNLYDDSKIEREINYYKNNKFFVNHYYIDYLIKKLEKYREDSKDLFNKKFFNHEEVKRITIEKELLTISFELIFEIYKDSISHYCRNVYHILKFIRENENNKTLGIDNHKYKNYANIFQSQLNVDEQFLLYYNFIHFNKETDNEMFWTINLVNHYEFLENIGIENLIDKKHELFYNFRIKGSDRIIE